MSKSQFGLGSTYYWPDLSSNNGGAPDGWSKKTFEGNTFWNPGPEDNTTTLGYNQGGGAAAGAAKGAGMGFAAAANPYVAAGVVAFDIWSGIQNAEMIRSQAQTQARINNLNADSMAIDAYKQELHGYDEIARYEPKIDETLADQRVALASSNVDVNSGTAKALQEETRLTGFLNKLDMDQAVRQQAITGARNVRLARIGSAMSQSASDVQARAAVFGGIAQGVQTGISAYARR